MDELGDATASPSLVPLSTKEELLSWAEKIKPHLPYSTSIHNNLTLHGGGYASHGRFYVLQGRPNTHAVVYYWGTFRSAKQDLAVFCREEEVDQVIKALSTADFVNWDRGLIIHHVPRYLLGVLQKLAEEKGAKIITASFVAYTYQPHLDTQPKRIGPGFRVCLLSKAGIHNMFEKDKYGRLDHLEVATHIAQHVPYLGVYQDKGVTQDTIVDPNNLPMAGDEELPVAWVGGGILGAIGKLMTDEGYRRRGLGSLIITVAARRQASLLKIVPHAFVETANIASCAMFDRLPGWEVTHDIFWLITPM